MYTYNFIKQMDNVITTMVIRLLDDPTRCAQSVVADLPPLCSGYVGVRMNNLATTRVFLLAPH